MITPDRDGFRRLAEQGTCVPLDDAFSPDAQLADATLNSDMFSEEPDSAVTNFSSD